MQKNLHYRVFVILLVYGVLKFMGGSFGSLLLYPVTMLVTFLHEFGHALGAILTGGSVEGLQVNSDERVHDYPGRECGRGFDGRIFG
jgi:Zn-dependent oligopeptidase